MLNMTLNSKYRRLAKSQCHLINIATKHIFCHVHRFLYRDNSLYLLPKIDAFLSRNENFQKYIIS